jgi:hypothetical protein
MKRLYILMLALPLFAGCLADYSDVNVINAASLEKYAMQTMIQNVTLPVEALELAIDFDEYLKKTDEEKEKDVFFYGNISKEQENEYVIKIDFSKFSDEYRTIYCILNTKGCSLTDVGAEWEYKNFNMYGNDFSLSNLDYSFSLPQDSKLTVMAEEESTWAVTFDEHAACRMKMKSKNDSLYEWLIEAQGKETTTREISADFGTSGNFTIKERSIKANVKENIYSGKFNVNIYKDGEPYDYCYLTFTPGEMMKSQTSR